MDTLPQLFPKVDDLLTMPPDDLAPVLLAFAREAMKRQNRMFDPNYVNELALGEQDHREQAAQYPQSERQKVRLHLAEVWSSIESDRLVMPSPDMNGAHGYKVFTRRGAEIANAVDFKRLRDAGAFPKELLHPLIADKVWQAITRNDFGNAVATAFKAVEEQVRGAAGLTAHEYGADLMRKAFDPSNGPLTDMAQPEGERKALPSFFASAMGYFRNPNAHRTVPMTVREAQDQAMLASHLLRIVDTRRKP